MSSLSKTTLTPYCKVCHDAGKQESIYMSHFIRETRDPSSKVVCPTLLAQECRYCFKHGHTVKYCKEIKRNQMKKNQQEKKEKVMLSVVSENDKRSNNIYQALTFDQDSDPEDDNDEEIVTNTDTAFSYKNIIEITKKQVLQEEIDKMIQAEKRKEELQRKMQEANQVIPTIQHHPQPPVYVRIRSTINWADDSSSDEDL